MFATEATTSEQMEPELWERARSVISGLVNRLPLQTGAREFWIALLAPSYISRCAVVKVWNFLAGEFYWLCWRHCGGLYSGYADPDVNAAVRRRISLGSYCSFGKVPQEVQFAESLLKIYTPGQAKVRLTRRRRSDPIGYSGAQHGREQATG